MAPRVFSSAATEPLLPSAPTRTASSAASSAAPAIAAPMSCSSLVTSDIASLRRQWQVGVVRPPARLRQHAVHLAAMVRLVIEHVSHEQPLRPRDVALRAAGVIREIAGEPRAVELVGPREDRLVERGALALETVPVRIERYRARNAALGSRHVGETTHPDTIGPEQMA